VLQIAIAAGWFLCGVAIVWIGLAYRVPLEATLLALPLLGYGMWLLVAAVGTFRRGPGAGHTASLVLLGVGAILLALLALMSRQLFYEVCLAAHLAAIALVGPPPAAGVRDDAA
jgi:hypothetical protein